MPRRANRVSLAGARDDKVRAFGLDWAGVGRPWRGAGAAFFCIIVVTAVDLFHTIQLHSEFQSSIRPTTHNPFRTKSSLSMALPKRIIKETERLMAEPYVYPSQTVAAMP